MNDFQNKIALVTGASRGIGKAIAISLAKKGAKVIGTATSKENVNIINNYLKNNGKGILMNFNDLNSIDKTLSDNKNLKNIDILINNAAITDDKLIFFIKNSDWQRIININLTSVFYLSKIVLRNMLKKRFGRIINIGSVVGELGNIGQTSYAATKSALIGFSKSLSREVSHKGITVNVVSPGFIESDMTNKMNKKQKNNILSKIPINRLGKAKEVADVVIFLSSQKASYITGETVNVNGGML